MSNSAGKPAVTWRCEATSGAGRAGTLNTPHGSVPTPCFMAVGTLGALKGISVQQAEAIGQGVMLGNTYHLALRPGPETVHELGGLHAFSGWRGPMLTDSGGYQVYSLANLRKITEHGVTFRSHLDGRKLEFTPEESIRIQRLLGADIIMAFDECPPATASHADISAAVDRTTRWLARSRDAWTASGQPRGAAVQALYGIVQGGLVPELRARSAAEVTSFDLPGYALGGLAVGEGKDEREAVLDHTTPLLPADRPRYLMGVGTPLDLVEAVVRGVDQFDCVLPTRMGRHGIAYCDAGPIHCKRAEFAKDPRPLDPDTPSEASRLTRGALRHLLKSGEALGGVLIALHNLAYYQRLMRRLRAAILTDQLDRFATAFRAGWHE